MFEYIKSVINYQIVRIHISKSDPRSDRMERMAWILSLQIAKEKMQKSRTLLHMLKEHPTTSQLEYSHHTCDEVLSACASL